MLGGLAAIISFVFSTVVFGYPWRPILPWGKPVNAPPRLGAVSSGDSQCSEIGLQMLTRGGTAVDAAVATEFCLGVKLPDLVGIGGGGFALVRGKNGHYDFVDFRESAPAASTEDMFKGRENDSLVGGLAVGVPGEIRGLHYLHQRYGSLPWEVLVKPSIQLSRNGFKLGEYLNGVITRISAPNFLLQEPWAQDFAPDGTLVSLGGLIKRKRLSETLEVIAKKGPEGFYRGSLAQNMINTIQRQGGVMTTEDLNEYNITLRDTIEIKYRGYRVIGTSAPSGSPVVLSALKIAEGYRNLGSLSAVNQSTHFIDEALRFGYGQRTELGDPEFVPSVKAFQDKILSTEMAKEIRSMIKDDSTLPVDKYNPNNLEVLSTPGTSHLVSADRWGLVVSLTSTVNTAFGARLMDPKSGIILNNEMNDFSIPGSTNFFGFEPSPNNFIRPGKRPQSSMSPVIVEGPGKNEIALAVGGQGGSRIISAVAQVLWYVLDWKKNCSSALVEPRFHDQLQPNQMFFETTYNSRTVASMAAKGHNVTWTPRRQAAVHALRRLEHGIFDAAADPDQKGSGGLVA
ncbi:gamma-glutamyltransferase [Fusarium albosuccineum]|uniref:Glutathione hydrolase n=1 Tax=Fusarium albosuccineum TaxID=1237068 RepID=A0A8H4PGT0_9HYPO|nr:gamma-glutamyltransferase [Fusarium albosuccineum]